MKLIPHDLDVTEDEPGGFVPDTAMRVSADVTAVVVDAQAAVREGLPLLLRPHGIEVVATASTGKHAAELVDVHAPDVALVARDLVDADGLVLLRQLVRRGSRSAFVLYADDEDGRQAALAVRGGAAGVVAKRRTMAELAQALTVVAAGGVWLDEGVGPAPEEARAADAGGGTAALSDAERRVLTLVARGASTEEVAEDLTLSPHTVRTHVRNAMRKLDASTRAHAVAIALRDAAIEL